MICFFGVSYKVKSITLADIELFITLGIIPAENAQKARDFLTTTKTDIAKNAGAVIKNNATSTAQCLVINQNLIKGKSGTLVSALQRFLKSEGNFPKGQEITGFFGDITVQAVADFQLVTGLIKTGNQLGAGTVGPITQKKIQEISCAKAVEIPAIATTSTVADVLASSTPRQSFYSDNISSITGELTTVKVQEQERYLDVDTGNLKLKYEVFIDPPESASYFEVVLICDPSALDMKSKDIKECGKIFRIGSIRKGRKAINVDFINKSKFPQPIIFAVEVFDENKKSVGFVEKQREVIAAKPVIKFEVGDTTVSQYESGFIQSRNCSWDERLDFIRYTMTPYSPTNTVSLPVCWPGELLCTRGNPPDFCEITGGPSSNDLCSSSQKFVNGKCIAK